MAATSKPRKSAPRKAAARPAPRVIDQDGGTVDDDYEDDTTVATVDEFELKTITWNGEKFTFPAEMEDWPAEAVEAFEKRQAMTAVHELLGDEQYQRLLAASRRRSVKEVAQVMEMVGEEMGFEGSGE